MEALQGALVEILTPLLLALLSAVVGYVVLTMRNFLKNKRVVAFVDRIKKEHSWVYDIAVNFAVVAEEHVADQATNFAENDRYQYVRDLVQKRINELAKNTGLSVHVTAQDIDALVRKAILEAQKAYEEANSPSSPLSGVKKVL